MDENTPHSYLAVFHTFPHFFSPRFPKRVTFSTLLPHRSLTLQSASTRVTITAYLGPFSPKDYGLPSVHLAQKGHVLYHVTHHSIPQPVPWLADSPTSEHVR